MRGTPQFVPPQSCLERVQEIPAVRADASAYIKDLIELYSESGVLREQCRAALIVKAEGK